MTLCETESLDPPVRYIMFNTKGQIHRHLAENLTLRVILRHEINFETTQTSLCTNTSHLEYEYNYRSMIHQHQLIQTSSFQTSLNYFHPYPNSWCSKTALSRFPHKNLLNSHFNSPNNAL